MLRARPEFKLADMWVGVFWRKEMDVWAEDAEHIWEADRVDVWICLLPCLPIHVVWQGKTRPHELGTIEITE